MRHLTLAMLALTALPAAAEESVPAPANDGGFQLDTDRQKVIWDAEHIVFKFEKYLAPDFGDALCARDADGLKARLREEARIELPAPGAARGVERRGGPVVEQSLAWGKRREADGDALAAWLLEQHAPIASCEAKRLRILSIEPTEDEEGWRTECLLLTRGTDSEGRPVEINSHHEIELRFADPEAIETQPVISAWRPLDSVRREAERPLLVEATAAFGLDELGLADNWELETELTRQYRFQVAVEDYDRDGYPDLAIATIHGEHLLLRNIEGKRFEDVTALSGVRPSRISRAERPADAMAAFFDADGDGRPELLLGQRIYKNLSGEREEDWFVDVTAKSGLRFDRVPLGVNVADYDLDGDLDLYVIYQKKHDTRPPAVRPWVGDVESGADNELWRNEGGLKFVDVTDEAGAGGGKRQTFAATTLYLDDDRYPDLYLANDFGKNVSLRNKGDGSFEDLSREIGAEDYATSMGVTSGDFDNDGRAEIYVANMYSKMGRRIIEHVGDDDYPPGIYEQIEGSCAGNRLYVRGADGRFDDVGDDLAIEAVGWAYAPSMVDLDGDGWLDIYATTGFMSFERGKPDG